MEPASARSGAAKPKWWGRSECNAIGSIPPYSAHQAQDDWKRAGCGREQGNRFLQCFRLNVDIGVDGRN